MGHSYHKDLRGVKSTKVGGVQGSNLYLLPVIGSVLVARLLREWKFCV